MTWEGWVPFEQVKTFYASHDSLFTSLKGHGGVHLLEAMAYEIPVITLDLQVSSFIREADRGIKIKAMKPNETARELS